MRVALNSVTETLVNLWPSNDADFGGDCGKDVTAAN